MCRVKPNTPQTGMGNGLCQPMPTSQMRQILGGGDRADNHGRQDGGGPIATNLKEDMDEPE